MTQVTEVRRCVTILKARDEVYEALRQPEVWSYIVDGGRIEGRLEVDELVPNERMAWHAQAPSELPHSGSLWLKDAPAGRGTEVCVSVVYEPPAGRVGQLVMRLLGEAPKQTLTRHLHRLRQILEAGEISTIEGQPSGRVERAAREQKEQPVAHGSVEEPRS